MATITVTESEAARNCGWQWQFNSPTQMYLENANPLQSLYAGTLWHKALESMAQKQSMPTPHKFVSPADVTLDPTMTSVDKIKCELCGYDIFAHMDDPLIAHAQLSVVRIQQHYEKLTGRKAQQLELKKTYDIIGMLQAMMTNYMQYYHGELLPADFKYVRTEQQFFKVLPNTEHCTCYYNKGCKCTYTKNGIRKSCRYKNGYYKYCKCEQSNCKCRESHRLEGKLDGLIQHIPTGNIFILENKTFSVHTQVKELRRIPQFMGYTWIGEDFNIAGMLYNGAWTRSQVPNGKSMHDMFIRHMLSWTKIETDNWASQLAVTAMQIHDPRYIPVRRIHPVGGCMGVNNCSYKLLCDARFSQPQNYDTILATNYRRREADDIEGALSEV